MAGFSFREIISNIVGSWVADVVTPASMTTYALDAIGLITIIWVVIGWHRRQRAAKKLGMASWYFIIPCLVIAACAVAGAFYGIGLRGFGVPSTDAAQPKKDGALATYGSTSSQGKSRIEGPIGPNTPRLFEDNGTANQMDWQIRDPNSPPPPLEGIYAAGRLFPHLKSGAGRRGKSLMKSKPKLSNGGPGRSRIIRLNQYSNPKVRAKMTRWRERRIFAFARTRQEMMDGYRIPRTP